MTRRFRPYFRYLHSVRAPLAGALLAAVVFGAAAAGLAFIMEKALPRLFADDAASLTDQQLFGYAALIPLVFLVRGVAGYLNTWLITLCGVRILERMRRDFFARLQVLPLAFFSGRQTGDPRQFS